MQAVRWGLLSTARISDAVLAGGRQSDRISFVAVASRDLSRAEAYAHEHDIERAHGSYEALLDDGNVEAVYISLPNSLHVEWSVRALEAGKHVLCEKPLDRRPDEVVRAFDAAERAGRLLMEGFMYRHHPQTRELERVVADGRIGELRHMRTAFSFTLDDPANVRLRAELDGGALMDVGCYCVSGCRLLAGEPKLVFGQQRIGPTGVDIRFTGLLSFAADVSAEFYCGFDVPYASGFEAIGSEGSVLVRAPVTCRDPHLELNGERIEVEDVDRYQLELENFSAAIRGEAEPLLGRDDALGQARAIDALYRSAASGAVVSL